MGSEWILGRLAWGGGWIGFDWLRTGTGGGLLWVRWWTFGFLRHGVSFIGMCFPFIPVFYYCFRLKGKFPTHFLHPHFLHPHFFVLIMMQYLIDRNTYLAWHIAGGFPPSDSSSWVQKFHSPLTVFLSLVINGSKWHVAWYDILYSVMCATSTRRLGIPNEKTHQKGLQSNEKFTNISAFIKVWRYLQINVTFRHTKQKVKAEFRHMEYISKVPHPVQD
jgi:hypothetical protein